MDEYFMMNAERVSLCFIVDNAHSLLFSQLEPFDL